MTKVDNQINKGNLQPLHFNSYLRVSKESDSTATFTIETQTPRIIEFLDRSIALESIGITNFKPGVLK